MSGERSPICRATFVIQNRLGLHARAAALFVQTLTAIDADVFVSKDGQTVNGKSIMGLMMLAAGKGSSIDVEARGPAAEQALATIASLVDSKFREEE
ncbi:MAG: HPr family phosphocarrier protein [Candidatus Binatia bacterium]